MSAMLVNNLEIEQMLNRVSGRRRQPGRRVGQPEGASAEHFLVVHHAERNAGHAIDPGLVLDPLRPELQGIGHARVVGEARRRGRRGRHACQGHRAEHERNARRAAHECVHQSLLEQHGLAKP
jgi:hypothetical protein